MSDSEIPGSNQSQAGPRALSEEELDEIAERVVKSLKPKHINKIASHIGKSLRPEHFVLIGKSMVKSPIFWIFALVGIGLGCYSAWKAVPHFIEEKAETEFNNELTNQIKLQFAEPRISNIVESVADSEAKQILRNEVSPEITAFEKSLSNQVKTKHGDTIYTIATLRGMVTTVQTSYFLNLHSFLFLFRIPQSS